MLHQGLKPVSIALQLSSRTLYQRSYSHPLSLFVKWSDLTTLVGTFWRNYRAQRSGAIINWEFSPLKCPNCTHSVTVEGHRSLSQYITHRVFMMMKSDIIQKEKRNYTVEMKLTCTFRCMAAWSYFDFNLYVYNRIQIAQYSLIVLFLCQ